METHVVIMAGGIGSRLWPVSTPGMPKQFIDLLGIGKTMIQLTVDRFRPVCDLKNFWVVTSADYVGIVKEQLPEIPAGHILAEPEPRNTAPCIAYACWKISSVSPDANIVVTPADALILNEQKFSNIIRKALNFTAEGNRIVTIGIEPTRPETGYGYIFAEEKRPEEVVKVRKFAVESFAESLLPVLDSLEAGLKVDNASAEQLREGTEATLRQLLAALERNKVVEVNPAAGDRFDPANQQAISMVPADQEANTVVSVLQKGYTIADRVLRPALVTVTAPK